MSSGRAMMTLQTLARALGGEICGRQVLAPGPGHSRKDRSLSVTIGRNGKLVVHSFTDDDWRAMRDYVRERAGLSDEDIAKLYPVLTSPETGDCKPQIALRIWEESQPPQGTLAEAYLRGRCLDLPASDCVRFHKSCRFGAEAFPALVSLIRNIATNEPQAIQRTALNHDGKAIKRLGKPLRMSLGPMAGGAIKIDPATNALCVGEGLESTLAGRQLGHAPAWALLSAGGLANLPVLLGIDFLTFIGENDAANESACKECARRWFYAGKKVRRVLPKSGGDFNDTLQERR